MYDAGDLVVNYLCNGSKHYRVFRDRYQLRTLIGLWREYVSREDRFNRYAEMTSHGPSHLESVATLVADLCLPTSFLTDSELFILLSLAYLHDVGLYETFDHYYSQPLLMRQIHGSLSMQRILRERDLLLPTLDNDEVNIIALLSSYHQSSAALSEEDLKNVPSAKRLRQPQASAADLRINNLKVHPTLEEVLRVETRNGASLFSLKQLPDPVCPFLVASLIKLLDGCDFQATRVGSIESLIRNLERNMSHARRSERIMEDCSPASPSHIRAEVEKAFFGESHFHFLRNLLIEKTLIVNYSRHRVGVVIKLAELNHIVTTCRLLVQRLKGNDPTTDDTLERMTRILDTLESYNRNPLMTVCKELGVANDDHSADEFRVDIPAGDAGNPNIVHFLIAKKYIERELRALNLALQSPDGDKTYHYCTCCTRSASCGLKGRRLPSFKDDKGDWDVTTYEPLKHVKMLGHVPSLTLKGNVQQIRAPYQRKDVEKYLVKIIKKNKQVILYGPHGRGKTSTTVAVTRILAGYRLQNILWHHVDDGKTQNADFICALARFFAANGDFSLQNLIHRECITKTHELFALSLLASGRLASQATKCVLCIDNLVVYQFDLSNKATISRISHTWSVNPAAIAGVLG